MVRRVVRRATPATLPGVGGLPDARLAQSERMSRAGKEAGASCRRGDERHDRAATAEKYLRPVTVPSSFPRRPVIIRRQCRRRGSVPVSWRLPAAVNVNCAASMTRRFSSWRSLSEYSGAPVTHLVVMTYFSGIGLAPLLIHICQSTMSGCGRRDDRIRRRRRRRSLPATPLVHALRSAADTDRLDKRSAPGASSPVEMRNSSTASSSVVERAFESGRKHSCPLP